jgi:hypothetical protein
MFALSSILQLFTGKKIVSLLAALGGLKLGLIGAGLIALGIGIKLTNDARKRELQYINGLSNAMKTTTDQVKTLGNFFGIVPTKLPFENQNREIVKKETRSARDTLRADAGFQKQFAPTIKTLSTSTAAQAKLAFTSLALNLKAQGFATEQVQTIIDALREEAGKTNVKLDVKSLNFSAESIKGLQSQIAPMILSLEKNEVNKEIKKLEEKVVRRPLLMTYCVYRKIFAEDYPCLGEKIEKNDFLKISKLEIFVSKPDETKWRKEIVPYKNFNLSDKALRQLIHQYSPQNA